MQFKAEARGILTALAGLLAVVLVLPVADVNIPGVLLLQSLYLHLLAAGVALVVAMVVFGMRWRAAGLVAVLLAAFLVTALPYWEMQKRRMESTGEKQGELTLLSYNVLSSNPTPGDAAQFIRDSNADVVVVMESPGVESELEALAEIYPYRVGCAQEDGCDLSVLSKYPPLGSSVILLRPFGLERLVWVRLEVDGAPVTVVGVHQAKPYFDNVAWLEVFFIRRELADLPGPMVIAGDFNSAPWSGQVVTLADRLGLAAAPWHPATWPVRAGPLGVPIDNMFTRGNARIVDISAGEPHGSNHRPLLARVELYAAP